MVAQVDDADCGPAALSTALTRWSAAPSPDAWQPRAHDGFTAGALRDEARRAGFASYVFEGTFGDLEAEIAAGHPVIVGLVRREHDRFASHFAVVVGHDGDARRWLLADPALGVRGVSSDELGRQWASAGWVTLVVFPRQ
jgi:predicted double-glycine peptidase